MAHRDKVKCDNVDAARIDRREKIGNTQVPVIALTRKGKPEAFFQVQSTKWKVRSTVFRMLIDDEIVSVRLAGEIAVHDFRREQSLFFCLFLQSLKVRIDLILQDFLIIRLVHFPAYHSPLAPNETDYEKILQDFIQRNILNDL